ncbi:glutathione S-transferase family protein [Gammaproteobacteria bacterium]|nr:glutathione S-transferase family protein [Gammaproteobacteria bacterium]OUX42674.1 MAG: hypothetical protein CBE21_03635 [Proteobacteria bacterium TMED261]
MDSPLKIYGVPMSQAVRSVVWLLLYKRVAFEFILTVPGSTDENGSRHPEYLAKFPPGTIPGLEDPKTGFVLYESHAIMCYLSNRFGWDDLYPKDYEARGRIDAFLNFHHRNLKEASIGYFAPKVRADLNLPELYISICQNIYDRALQMLESHWLAENRFMTGDQLTIADFTAYVEIGQLQDIFTNLYDYSGLPNVCRWLEQMKEVDQHDDVHLVLSELGDISEGAPTIEALMDANMKGFSVIGQNLASMNG